MLAPPLLRSRWRIRRLRLAPNVSLMADLRATGTFGILIFRYCLCRAITDASPPGPVRRRLNPEGAVMSHRTQLALLIAAAAVIAACDDGGRAELPVVENTTPADGASE